MSETVHKCDMAIVGGGIFGSAIAYYFKKDNPDKNVMVFEKNDICSGNTSLAAALMSRSSRDHMLRCGLARSGKTSG